MPILEKEEEKIRLASSTHTGNGQNKWPNPSFVGHEWKKVVNFCSFCIDFLDNLDLRDIFESTFDKSSRIPEHAMSTLFSNHERKKSDAHCLSR